MPSATLSQPVDWRLVADVTAELRRHNRGTPLAEFDVVAYAVARAAALHPRFRSTLADDGRLAESPHVALGIAVHLADDDLALAVVREADRLSLVDFATTLDQQIAATMRGHEAPHADVRLAITYLGGLPATEAVPVLIAPATGVLFIGAPHATTEGQRAKLCLTFDHRIVNGVSAARFLAEIGHQIEQLARPSPGESSTAPPSCPRGWLLEHLRQSPTSRHRVLVETAVIELASSLLERPFADTVTSHQPEASARQAGEARRVSEGSAVTPLSDGTALPPLANASGFPDCRTGNRVVGHYSQPLRVDEPHHPRHGVLSTTEPLRHLGLSSLAAVELSVRLGAALDAELPSTLIWSHPTIASIAAHLTERLGAAPPRLPTAPASASHVLDDADLLSKVASLTPAQTAALLTLFRNGNPPSPKS